MTCLSGLLRKSHASRSFESSNRLRFFVSTGFNVAYYKSERAARSSATNKGHFDLRNVVELVPVAEDEAPNAVKLLIAEGSSEHVTKRMIISFSPEPDVPSGLVLGTYRTHWMLDAPAATELLAEEEKQSAMYS